MLVAAPERWDEACFAVPAVRAVLASGLSVGVICREEQEEFWHTLPGLEVVGFSLKTKAKQLAAQLGADWQASLSAQLQAMRGRSVVFHTAVAVVRPATGFAQG